VRAFVIGYDDRKPTARELEQMKQLVRQGMQQGALGLSTPLIYAPATYARTSELIELTKAAAEYGGMYISHIRDEGDDGHQQEAVEEVATICRAAKVSAEIWHLKCAGKAAWGNMPTVVAQIQRLRDSGADISADVYPYIASSNDLDATLPSWVQDGGIDKMLKRLKNKTVRARMKRELKKSNQGLGVNFEGIMISSVNNPSLKQFEGKRLIEVARGWKKEPYEALFDFILQDSSRTGKVTFSMNEDDLREAMKQHWTSFCTDANARALDGPLFEGMPHPRSYGSMARVFAKYVRSDKLLSLEEAIRKMTTQPAQRVGLKNRGALKEGYFADVVVFDPNTVQDLATFENPHRYSVGISQTIVNGKVVWEDGAWTGSLSGRAVRKNVD
jgi:N-acyl-D-aspartate/D-glutamate deacylase